MKDFRNLIVCLCLFALVSCSANEQPEMVMEKDTMVLSQENAVIEAIMSRRSIRQYKSVVVGRDTLQQILTCGINAANGQNKQSWEIRVVDDSIRMKKIVDLMAKGNPSKTIQDLEGCFRGAPVMVFIARDLGYDFSAYDCGLFAGNVMLAAQSLGVGSICLGSPVRFINEGSTRDEILNLLQLSEGYELCLCVGLGYADESPEAKPRMSEKIKFLEF
jgi:nitroreductase